MSVHYLKASDATVRVGLIDQSYPPVLQVASGDEVILDTWGLWGNAVTPEHSYAQVQEIRARYAGRGPHSMTGPIEILGARAGEQLRVDILDLQLGPYGFNMITPQPTSRGLLTEDFPDGQIRHFVFDLENMQTEFLPGMQLPLRPFLGILGVAPADTKAHISSIPDQFGGNIDCPDLVAGTSVFLPVLVDGALFYAGDAHAMQGCGEVNQTALETSMRSAHLRLSLCERRLDRPHAETPEHIITMGFHTDLREAAKQAVGDMVAWLARDYGFARADAYVLCSLQLDLLISQAVNGNNGVHARLSKQLLASRT